MTRYGPRCMMHLSLMKTSNLQKVHHNARLEEYQKQLCTDLPVESAQYTMAHLAVWLRNVEPHSIVALNILDETATHRLAHAPHDVGVGACSDKHRKQHKDALRVRDRKNISVTTSLTIFFQGSGGAGDGGHAS